MSHERKQEKPKEKRPRKRTKVVEPGRLSSTLLSIGKAIEEHTGWGKRWGRRKRTPIAQAVNEAVDNEVLSEVFSKLGIETKIDQIEAEFNAEARAARAATRNNIEAAAPKASMKEPPSHFDVAYGALATRQQKFWTTAVCTLGFILAFQSVFLFRDHIARTFPDTRPTLVSLCNVFGCTMPLPRDASRIKVTYGFNKRDERHYVFYATVTNEANFTQDWPSLELTLHNFIEQPLSRRIFTPTEWVPAEKFNQRGMPPKSQMSTHLELEVTEIVPSKSDLTHFYP